MRVPTFNLRNRKSVDLRCVGWAYIAVGRGHGQDARVPPSRGVDNGERQSGAGQLRGIDDAPVRRLGLQTHVEGQRVIGANHRETVEPSVVVGESP